MYLDINENIDKKTAKLDELIQMKNGSGIRIAMGRNFRSKVWHDNLTHPRGETEEIVTSRNLHNMNEECERITFRSRRGSSNIDLRLSTID